jgi:hypothetical protein
VLFVILLLLLLILPTICNNSIPCRYQ